MLSKLKTRLRALLRKSEMERELDEEMRHHIERQTEQNIRLGMTPEEARYAARKAFGGLNAIVVDEEFACRYWPNEDPIGQRVRLPWGPRGENPVLTVIGVVGRVKLVSCAASV